MNGYSSSARDIAYDIVPRNGIAAMCKAYKHILLPLYYYIAAGFQNGTGGFMRLLSGLWNVVLAAIFFNKAEQHLNGSKTAVAYGCIQVICALKLIAAHDRLQPLMAHKRRQRVSLPFSLLFHHIATLDNVLFTEFLFEPLPYLAFGLICLYNVKPIAAGPVRRCRG